MKDIDCNIDIQRIPFLKEKQKYQYVPLLHNKARKMIWFATMLNEEANRIQVFKIDYNSKIKRVDNWLVDIRDMNFPYQRVCACPTSQPENGIYLYIFAQ